MRTATGRSCCVGTFSFDIDGYGIHEIRLLFIVDGRTRHGSYCPRRSPPRDDRISEPSPAPGIRPLTQWMRYLLYAASLLAFLAGFQLAVFSERTAMYLDR